MTAPMIPDYILTLYENEIRKVVKKCIVRISEENDLNVASLESQIADIISLEIVSEDFEKVTITKKIARKKIVSDEERCVARVKRTGVFSQCTRCSASSSMLCKIHTKKTPWGQITDPPPEENVTRSRKCLH